MEESADESGRREKLIQMYHATKDALDIMSELITTTTSTPVPPPIINDQEDNRLAVCPIHLQVLSMVTEIHMPL